MEEGKSEGDEKREELRESWPDTGEIVLIKKKNVTTFKIPLSTIPKE